MEKRLRRFDKDVAERASQQALNRTADTMRREGIKAGVRWLGLPQKVVVRRFSFQWQGGSKHGAVGVVGARRWTRMQAVIVFKGRPFNLVRWNTHNSPKGVISNAWGESKVYDKTALVTVRGGQSRFVARLRTKRQGKKRLANKGAYGPGLTHAVEDPAVKQHIITTGETEYPARFVTAANFYMQRAGYTGVAR